MTNDQIEKFVHQKYLDTAAVQVNFKSRQPITGMFIKTTDYAELRSKNFWRIVRASNMEEYNKSKDPGLARIFNGMEMTKLEAIR